MWGSARFVYNTEKISHRENLTENVISVLRTFIISSSSAAMKKSLLCGS